MAARWSSERRNKLSVNLLLARVPNSLLLLLQLRRQGDHRSLRVTHHPYLRYARALEQSHRAGWALFQFYYRTATEQTNIVDHVTASDTRSVQYYYTTRHLAGWHGLYRVDQRSLLRHHHLDGALHLRGSPKRGPSQRSTATYDRRRSNVSRPDEANRLHLQNRHQSRRDRSGLRPDQQRKLLRRHNYPRGCKHTGDY